MQNISVMELVLLQNADDITKSHQKQNKHYVWLRELDGYGNLMSFRVSKLPRSHQISEPATCANKLLRRRNEPTP